MPVIPLLLALSAVGLWTALTRITSRPQVDPSSAYNRRRRYVTAAVIGAAMSALMIVKAVDATLASTGQWADRVDGGASVWHHWEGANLALAETGRRSDLCGVLLVGIDAAWSGGFTYLHRDVPFVTLQNAPAGWDVLLFANYVVLAPGVPPPPGYVTLDEFRGWSVGRRDGGCVSPPRPLTRLFP